MKKITNKEISNFTNKSVSTIAGWSTKQPKLLEVVKLGSLCKKHGITIEFLETCTKLQEISQMLDKDKKSL